MTRSLSSKLGQVLGPNLLRAFGNDNLVKMMKQVTEYKFPLRGLCRILVESHEVTAAREAVNDMPDAMQMAVASIVRAAGSMLALLSPKPLPGCPASQVQDLLEYKGDEHLLIMVRDNLKLKPWVKMWEDVLVKGAATEQLMPDIERLEQNLSADTVSNDILVESVSALKHLRTKVRAGALNAAETKLSQALIKAGKAIIDSNGKDVTMSLYDQMLQGLALFSDKESLTLHEKLVKYEVKISHSLITAELEQVLSNYPVDMITVGDFVAEPSRLVALSSAVNKCRDMSLDVETREKIELALFWHMRALLISLREPFRHQTLCDSMSVTIHSHKRGLRRVEPRAQVLAVGFD